MIMVSSNHIGYFLSSSLWITVLIVRVGCIIEAHASSVEVGLEQQTNKDSKEDFPATLLRQSGVKKKITSSRKLHISRNFSGSTTKATTTVIVVNSPVDDVIHNDKNNNNNFNNNNSHDPNDDDDTCVTKIDGYFPNYGSDCTSYYFCAAGYQLTYVCPPDTRFNEQSKKCEEDVKCLSKGHHNLCNGLSNGYYSKAGNRRQYYYCHNNAKVIDLMCDVGKIFDGNKCSFHEENKGTDLEDRQKLEHVSCEGKTNGFYPILNSGCKKYYYCILGEKTELKCEIGKVFNGDICVLPTQYNCPLPTNSSENSIIIQGSSGNANTNSRVEDPPNNSRRKDRAEESLNVTSTETASTSTMATALESSGTTPIAIASATLP